MIPALVVVLLQVQQPTPNLLVEVELVGTDQRVTVEAVLTADSVLLLPARELHALLGLPQPTTMWTNAADLHARFPTVTVTWVPRELRLLVDDPFEVLPATRAFRTQLARQARGGPGLAVTRGGPFVALAADDRGRQLVEGGYSFRGRLAVQARRSSIVGTAWAVSLAPSPILFLSYSDGDQQAAAVTGRLAVGPTWLSTSWLPHRPLQADALMAIGPVAVFASTRRQYVLTVRGPVDLQVGRSGAVTAARLSLGPFVPSPFSFPVTR